YQLTQACRLAKEALLSPEGPAAVPVAVLSRGSRILEQKLSTEITREEALEVILEGFFPRTSPEEAPRPRARTGLKAWGLPYAQDPAVPRHLSAFLSRHPGSPPDAILLNGGVLNPPRVAERLLSLIRGFYPGREIRLLSSASLDLAVARGAAAYGLTRRGIGV